MDTMNKKPAQTIRLNNMTIPYNTENWQPRNFRGLERINQKTGKLVNREGERNFCIFLPDTIERVVNKQTEFVTPDQLKEEGWNISKSENQVDPQAEPNYMLRVKVKWHPENSDLARLNPKIQLWTQNGNMMMDEENVGDLDNAQIVKANLTIRATWKVTPSYVGYVAYLDKLALRIYEEDNSLEALAEGLMD